LLGYLQGAWDAVLWKLDDLSDYDVRDPLTLDCGATRPTCHPATRPGGSRLPRAARSGRGVVSL